MSNIFFENDRAPLCAMVQARTPEAALDLIKRSIDGGCDAIGLQFCVLECEYNTSEYRRQLIAACGEKPVYATNYRGSSNSGKSDDELASELIDIAASGAELIDVMGDLFCPTPGELTLESAAVAKQKELIGAIHAEGKKVLMSSHVLKFTPAERVLDIAMRQRERGADFVKIVTGAESVYEEIENLRITALLKEKLDVPFLFLSGGSHCHNHRMIGVNFGSSMYLCVVSHHELATKAQPMLYKLKNVIENY